MANSKTDAYDCDDCENESHFNFLLFVGYIYNIEKIQRRYSKLEANLDNQAKRMQNNAQMFFRNAFGCGVNDFNLNPGAYMYGAQNNAGIYKIIQNAIQSGSLQLGGDKFSEISSQEELFEILNGKYKPVSIGGRTVYVDASSTTTIDENTPIDESIQAKVAQAQQIQAMANMEYQNMQGQCANASSMYNTNVSIWLEAAKEQLEAEQDAALAPLQEQETEWDLEESSMETQLQMARERLKNIEQACSEEIKNSTPKFGLG